MVDGSDAIPEFSKSRPGEAGNVSLTNLSAFSAGSSTRSAADILAIIAVAFVVIGGTELALRLFEVPQYIMPPPSAIAVALVTDFPFILPHLRDTLVELAASCQGNDRPDCPILQGLEEGVSCAAAGCAQQSQK